MKLFRFIAGRLARSVIFAQAERLAERNHLDWNLSLGQLENLWVSLYLLLTDYGTRSFPARARSREDAHESECQYGRGLGNISPEEFLAKEMRKPFWDADSAGKYLNGFVRLLGILESLGVRPPDRLLELGAGSGWMAQFFALTGYNVIATTLVASDVAALEERAAALRAKGVASELSFKLSPMEMVDEVVPAESCEAVYVHQALHHANDWRATLGAAHHTLKRGGWLIIADEPNVLHTLIGYRMGKMSGTRELGMSRREITRALREIGYREIRVLAPKINDRLHPHWIAARR